MPEGYMLTKFMGENKINDPELREFYNQLQIIISGSIFNLDRFKYIFNINTMRLPISFVNNLPYEVFNRLVHFSGFEVKNRTISIILGAKALGQRLFFRAQGDYEVEIRGNLGSKILSKHKFITDNEEATVHHLELTDGADLIHFSPLNGEYFKIYFALTAPRKTLNIEIVTTDFVTFNVRIPQVFIYTNSNLKIELIWLKTTNAAYLCS
jgi:hypothetical protein